MRALVAVVLLRSPGKAGAWSSPERRPARGKCAPLRWHLLLSAGLPFGDAWRRARRGAKRPDRQLRRSGCIASLNWRQRRCPTPSASHAVATSAPTSPTTCRRRPSPSFVLNLHFLQVALYRAQHVARTRAGWRARLQHLVAPPPASPLAPSVAARVPLRNQAMAMGASPAGGGRAGAGAAGAPPPGLAAPAVGAAPARDRRPPPKPPPRARVPAGDAWSAPTTARTLAFDGATSPIAISSRTADDVAVLRLHPRARCASSSSPACRRRDRPPSSGSTKRVWDTTLVLRHRRVGGEGAAEGDRGMIGDVFFHMLTALTPRPLPPPRPPRKPPLPPRPRPPTSRRPDEVRDGGATHGCLAAADPVAAGAACATTIDDAAAGAAPRPGPPRPALARRRGGGAAGGGASAPWRFSAARPGSAGRRAAGRDGRARATVVAGTQWSLLVPGRGWVVAVAGADAFGARAHHARRTSGSTAPRRLGPARWGC